MYPFMLVPYYVRDAVGGYNSITDEFFIFGGYDNYDLQDIGYIYEYKTGIWKPISVDERIYTIWSHSQYYTQYNNIIYYYAHPLKKINTYNMTFPYSHGHSIETTGITMNEDPCLSSDIYGNLFLSSGGVAKSGDILNYFGYNINDSIWKTFTHSQYWYIYTYDMKHMACIIHNQVLYTFGGYGGGKYDLLDNYGSNVISYHNISDYNKPFLSNGYSLWNKTSQDLNPRGGFIKAVVANDLIYIIGMHSHNANLEHVVLIGWMMFKFLIQKHKHF